MDPIIEYYALSGETDQLQALIAPLDYDRRLNIVKDAVRIGDLSVLKVLHQITFPSAPRKLPFPPELVDLAVRQGQVEVVDWLIELMNKARRPVKAPIKAAIESGDVGMFNHVVNKFGIKINKQFPINSIDSVEGMDVIKYLHDKYHLDYPENVMELAAGAGDVDMMKRLRANGMMMSSSVLIKAIEHGHPKAAKFYFDNMNDEEAEDYELAEERIVEALLVAIKRGYDKIVKLLYDQYEWHKYQFIEEAIKHGRTKILKLLDYLGSFSSDQDEVDDYNLMAAKYGQVGVLQYLYNAGLRPSENILYKAMDLPELSVKVVAFLRLHGAAIDDDLLEASKKHPDVYQYLIEREVPLPSGLSLVARQGLVSILERFYNEGIKPNDGVADQAAEFGQLHMLEWLYEHGYMPSSKGMMRAIENGFDDVLKFLLDNGMECNQKCLDVAAANGHTSIVGRLVHDHGIRSPNAIRLAIENGHLELAKELQLIEE